MVIEVVSKVRNFVISGGGRLGKDLVIYGMFGKIKVIEAVSTIRNLTPLRNLSPF